MLQEPILRERQFYEMLQRPRRNRKSEALRSLLEENRLHPADFVAPLFIVDGAGKEEPIPSMPEQYRYTIDRALHHVEELLSLGISTVDLFTLVPKERKDASGSEAIRRNNLLQEATSAIKASFPELTLMVDIALDPYTSHGHDGVADEEGKILNDETLLILTEMAILTAECGADIVAPSDMMDGRVEAIRRGLDENGFSEVAICSYAAKYASSFYGPFRDALQSAPKYGDKKSYQINPANITEAIREALLDEAEGADMLLVKPGIAYLDVLVKIKEQVTLPVGIYHVSGEYSMVMAAAERGWVDADRLFEETLLCMKRAGADFIFSYAAARVARNLRRRS